jgi:hypothetical protein
MKNCDMLDRLLEIHQEAILDELSLQERLLVKRAVVKALEADVPEVVLSDLTREEVLLEVHSEVVQLVVEEAHRVGALVCLYFAAQ